MSFACIKSSGLCPVCITLGVVTTAKSDDGSEVRALEIRDLCRPCVRKTRSSYVEVLNPKRQDIVDLVRAARKKAVVNDVQ